MNHNDPLWMPTMRKAFEQGYVAGSILDNPYWKNYPKDSTTEEESKGRHWVEGFYQKLRTENETTA